MKLCRYDLLYLFCTYHCRAFYLPCEQEFVIAQAFGQSRSIALIREEEHELLQAPLTTKLINSSLFWPNVLQSLRLRLCRGLHLHDSLHQRLRCDSVICGHVVFLIFLLLTC